MTSAKTLVVSLDCVNADLLDRWSREGRLPTLNRLRETSATARVRAKSISVESDWNTFYAGRQPAEHGHVSYDEIIPGTYRSAITTGCRSQFEPFWQTVSQNGGRAVVLNPVHSFANPNTNGIVITDWLIHDAGHYFPIASHPTRIADDILRRYPDDPVNANDWGHSPNADPRRLLAGKRETLRRKVEFITGLLRDESWDIAYVGLDECHEMGHLFWHLHDPGHPRAADVSESGSFDPIAEILTDMDKQLGVLTELAPENCTIVVLSIGGIGPNYHWSHLVDTILARLDNPQDRSGSGYTALRRLWNSIPHSVQKPLHSVRHSVREALLQRRRRRSRAFALPINERAGGIRLNVAGREPSGFIEPGSAYDTACQDLISAFRELACAKTGAPLVKSIEKTTDIQAGPYLDLMPDLIIEWNTDQPISTAVSERTGRISRNFTDARTGHHLNDGFLLYSHGQPGPPSLSEPVDLADIGKAIVARHSDPAAAFGHGLFA